MNRNIINNPINTLYIKCEWIILDDNKSLKLLLDYDKIKEFETININGIEFKKI